VLPETALDAGSAGFAEEASAVGEPPALVVEAAGALSDAEAAGPLSEIEIAGA